MEADLYKGEAKTSQNFAIISCNLSQHSMNKPFSSHNNDFDRERKGGLSPQIRALICHGFETLQ